MSLEPGCGRGISVKIGICKGVVVVESEREQIRPAMMQPTAQPPTAGRLLMPRGFFRVQFKEDGSGGSGQQAARLHCSTEEIRKVFRAMDKKEHGGITAKELCEMMNKMGNQISEAETRKIVGQADKKGTGMITEDDFVIYMRDRAVDFTVQLREAFQEMDTDKSGFLTPSQLRSGFERLGMTFSNPEFKDMLAVVDLDKSGGISWEEFLSAMQ